MLHEALGEAKQILTDEQLERFVEIIREDAVWYDFFYTELTTGLRRGEICGLQWRDFDADDGRLKICRAVHEERGGKLTTWDTKDISWCQNDHPAAQYCRIAPGEEKVRSDGMDLPPSVETRTAYPPEYCL